MKTDKEQNDTMLLCCPHCGPTKSHVFMPAILHDDSAYWVECPCGARTGFFGGPKAASNAWNKRHNGASDKERTVEFFKSLGVKVQDNRYYLTVYPHEEKHILHKDSYETIDFFFEEDDSFLYIEIES